MIKQPSPTRSLDEFSEGSRPTSPRSVSHPAERAGRGSGRPTGPAQNSTGPGQIWRNPYRRFRHQLLRGLGHARQPIRAAALRMADRRTRPIGLDRRLAGVISLPRVVWLGEDISLRSAPIPTVDTLRTGSGSAADGVSTGPRCEIVVPEGTGRVVVHFDDHERLEVELDAAAGTLTINRSEAGLDPQAHDGLMQATHAFDQASSRPAARIFIDGSVVEVFTSAGRALSTRIYPPPPPWRIEAPPNAHHWPLAP